MKPIFSFDFKKRIVKLAYLKNAKLAIIHQPNTFRILDGEEDYRSHFGLAIKSEEIRPNSQSVSISNDLRFFASGDNKEKKINIYSISQKELLFSVSKHNGEIESIAFDWLGRYLISGGIDGKVFLYSLNTGLMLGRLPSHPDYVSKIAISPDGIFVISGGYEGGIWINNINTNSKPRRLQVFDKKITEIIFISQNRAIIGSEIGDIVVIDYLKAKVLKRIKFLEGQIISLATAMSDKYLFVASESLKIPVYEIENGEQVSPHIIVVGDEVSSMAFLDEKNHLCVGTNDGRLYIYNLADDSDLKELTNKGDYKRAYKIIEQNPLLKRSIEYERLEAIWNDFYKGAIDMMIMGYFDNASELLSPFKEIPQKGPLVARLIRDYKEYGIFADAIDQKKFARAYSIAEKYPTLKESEKYLELEKEWEKAFNKAKNALINLFRPDIAKEYLKEFFAIPSKVPIIHMLIRNTLTYERFIESLKVRDFKTFFSIVSQNKALKNTKEYEEAMKIGQKLLEHLKAKILHKEFDQAVSIFGHLQYFKEFHEELKELEQLIKAARHFMHYYNSKNYVGCFKVVDKYPELLVFDESIVLEKEWQKIIKDAEMAAQKGDAAKIKELFAPYVEMQERYEKISFLLKICYIRQIDQAIHKKKINTEELKKAFLTYIGLFGYDDEIDEVATEVSKKIANFDIVLDKDSLSNIKPIYEAIKDGSFPERVI